MHTGLANHPDLLAKVPDSFALTASVDGTERTVQNQHDPFDVRICETISDPAVLAWLDPERRWRGLQAIARVTATRQVGEQAPTTAVRYYLTSLPGSPEPVGNRERAELGAGHGLPRG